MSEAAKNPTLVSRWRCLKLRSVTRLNVLLLPQRFHDQPQANDPPLARLCITCVLCCTRILPKRALLKRQPLYSNMQMIYLFNQRQAAMLAATAAVGCLLQTPLHSQALCIYDQNRYGRHTESTSDGASQWKHYLWAA